MAVTVRRMGPKLTGGVAAAALTVLVLGGDVTAGPPPPTTTTVPATTTTTVPGAIEVTVTPVVLDQPLQAITFEGRCPGSDPTHVEYVGLIGDSTSFGPFGPFPSDATPGPDFGRFRFTVSSDLDRVTAEQFSVRCLRVGDDRTVAPTAYLSVYLRGLEFDVELSDPAPGGSRTLIAYGACLLASSAEPLVAIDVLVNGGVVDAPVPDVIDGPFGPEWLIFLPDFEPPPLGAGDQLSLRATCGPPGQPSAYTVVVDVDPVPQSQPPTPVVTIAGIAG